MRNVRILTVAIAVLSLTFVAMPAMSLSSQGGACGSTCSVWDDNGVPYSSCDAGGGYWASCSARIYCEKDGAGTPVTCHGECTGTQCYWV